MEQIIKQIKKDLRNFKKEHNLVLKHTNNHYQEILEYTKYYGLNINKHKLAVRIILQKKESSLSLTYNFLCTKKNCDINESYSFMDKDTTEYPCFTEEDIAKLKEIYDFDSLDGEIKNRVPLETQAMIIEKVLQSRFAKLSEYVKSQNIK